MTHKENVKRWYSFLGARWYNPFRGIWTWLISGRAEKEMWSEIDGCIGKDSKIVELGCGTGINAKKLSARKFKSYLGIDFSDSMLRIAKQGVHHKRFEFRQGDITKADMKGKFDIIICTWVLSHLDKPSLVVNTYLKTLGKGGKMYIIFLSKPPWYINFWFYPWTRMFATRYVSDGDIKKMKGKKHIKRFGSITTLLQINK